MAVSFIGNSTAIHLDPNAFTEVLRFLFLRKTVSYVKNVKKGVGQ